MKFTIKTNTEYNNTEIYFDGIPAAGIRTALKYNRFRWHSVKKCWYGKMTEADTAALLESITTKKPATEAAPAVKTPEAVPAAAVTAVTETAIDGRTAETLLAFVSKLDRLSRKDGTINYCDINTDLETVKKDLESVILANCNKSRNVPGSIEKAAARIIKQTSPARPKFKGATVFDDFTAICDGYRAIRFNADSAPVLETSVEPVEHSFYEKAFAGLNENNTIALELPTVAELKAKIKLDKAAGIADKHKPALWDFGDGLPALDAQFLIDQLECLPGCTARVNKNKSETTGVYFTAANGDGLLLPVRKAAAQNKEAA